MSTLDNPEVAKQQLDFENQEHGRRDGEPAVYTCPECGGTLWEFQHGSLVRMRCHVGHVYSEETFVTEQGKQLEATLWRVVRQIREHASVARMLGWQQEDEKSRKWYEQRAKDLEHQGDEVRRLLTKLVPLTPTPPASLS